jgi:pilus assembly protein CpaC
MSSSSPSSVSRKPKLIFFVGLIALAGWSGSSSSDMTQPLITLPTEKKSSQVQSQVIALVSGKLQLLSLNDDFERVSIGDPQFVDVAIVRPREIYLIGKKAGSSNVMVWTRKGQVHSYEVTVSADTYGLVVKLRELLPEEFIQVHAVGETLALSGVVSDSQRVHQAMTIAEKYSGRDVINMLGITELPQVLLEVKVAEVSRRLTDKLGSKITVSGRGSNFSYSMLGGFLTGGAMSTPAGTGGGIGIQSGDDMLSLEAEIKSGAIKILAEPNIIALSGQEGSFLAGGKVFIPVPTSGEGGVSTVRLEEREYGVSLKFLPTVLSGGKIHLRVTPEVSELASDGSAVSVSGVVNILPIITSRRASTTVQLFDGESFAIGGLIKNNIVESVSAVPLLGELPILGALFRSSEFLSDRSELMFIVTPRLVKPIIQRLAVPTDEFKAPSRGEFLFGGSPSSREPRSIGVAPEQNTQGSQPSAKPTEVTND